MTSAYNDATRNVVPAPALSIAQKLRGITPALLFGAVRLARLTAMP